MIPVADEPDTRVQAVKVILTKRDITQKKRADEERDLAIRQIINSAQ